APRSLPILDRDGSRGVSLVEGEDATEPFASLDAADGGNVFQGIVLPRSGAGSMPCSVRMRWMVDRPRSKPRFSSAPRSRVYPHDGFSRAIVSSCWTRLAGPDRRGYDSPR